MNTYQELAKKIVDEIGGVGNIDAVTNCMTRLRFTLKDVKLANVENLKTIKGIQGVVHKGGQFQVVIGADVSHVCDEIRKLGNFKENIVQGEEEASLISKVLGTITAIFQPVIPAICGAGMIKAVLAILTATNVLDDASQTFILLNMFADTAFYFLPIMLAFSSAKRFHCNPYFAAVLGGVLLHPTLAGLVAAGEAVHFVGLPVTLVSYGSAVVPPILIVFIQAYVEKFVKKISPNAVKVFLVPLVTFLIMAPLAIIAIGPLGSLVGDGLYVVFDFLNNEARWVIPVLMGAFCPWFVMTGVHYSFMPVQLAQYATLGYGTLLGPGMLASNIAQSGACFAVALRTKDKEMKETALTSGITALFGISEPALYGVTMRLKRPLVAVMIGGGIAGLWGGLTNMRTYASATAGVLALPVYVSDDFSNVINAVICITIAFVATFVITLLMGLKEDTTKQVLTSTTKEETPIGQNISSIKAPLTGKIVPLEQMEDEVFSKKIMGQGIAINPSEGAVVAPFDGVVNTIFPTMHAIGLTSDEGVEVIIHVGLDTVELEGNHFETFVKDGDKITKGTLLSKFDMEAIHKKGYNLITPIVVTNSNDFIDIIETSKEEVTREEEILKVFR